MAGSLSARAHLEDRQRAYPHEMLHALFEKPERDLTDEELEILEEPDDAIDVILRQLFGYPKPPNYLRVTHLQTAWEFSR